MKACSRKILELFYNAKHSGRIIKPDAIGRVGADDDGLVIELTWRVANDIIIDAKFRAFGNPNAIAITSLMTDNIIGKTTEDAMQIDEDVIKETLEEIRPEYIEVFDMVKMAMSEAYNNYLKRLNRKENAFKDVESAEYYDENDNLSQEEIEERLIAGIEQDVQHGGLVIDGEKRGRGRPRKEKPEGEEVVGEKRGRGRPRKVVDPTMIVEEGEKRGRGRPRKIVDEGELVEQGEKRGRGRPRKERPEGELEVIGEKRGRGRPRKERTETEEVIGEKRGRGRPRKEKPEGEEVVGEKRGRGRPRKLAIETLEIDDSEKRGRGRPRKEDVKFNLPKSDLDEVINDKDVEELINGKAEGYDHQQTNTFVDELISNKLIDEDDEIFDADYDLFKSNIRNIFSGKEVNHSSQAYGVNRTETKNAVENVNSDFNNIDEQRDAEHEFIDNEEVVYSDSLEYVIRGRGRPRKEHQEVEEDAGEKRGRGRPKKIVIETVEDDAEKRGRGRPRVNPVNSLTRSLTTSGGVHNYNNTQDIVFASKNVTTTNININVTKTTTSVEDNKAYSDDYSKRVNISSVQENSTVSTPVSTIEQEEEIEIEPVSNQNNGLGFKPFEDDNDIEANGAEDDTENDNALEDVEDEIDASHIKDEAPKGGIEDLLKALLSDD